MSSTVLDLTQEIFSEMQVFPLHSPTRVLPWTPRQLHGWTSNALFINEHAGTHLDAPSHFIKGGASVDQLDLARLTGPAVVLDLSHRFPGGLIGAGDLEQATVALPLEPDDAVLLWTGSDAHLGHQRYLDSFPGLSAEGAQFLLDRQVRLVGTDAAGIDQVEARACPVHHLLLPAGVPVLENLANLERLLQLAGGRRFTLHSFPLRIRGGTGSPVRAVAVIED